MIKKQPSIRSPRLRLLERSLQTPGNNALRDFWREIERQGTPIIEPGPDGDALVTFLWRDDGSAKNVAVIQDWGADGIREHHMVLLADSDVWFLTRQMRSDTRTTYQLSPSPSRNSADPAPYQPDPFNPKTVTAYLSENGPGIIFSLLELPAAPALSWRQTGSQKAGKVQLHIPFADQRRLWVYLPETRGASPLPVLIVFDGHHYKETLHLPKILDYLIVQGQIPPVAALMVDNPDRQELLCRDEFAAYIADIVIPWLRASYPVSASPAQTIVLGSSLGGLAAAFFAFRNPEICGKVLSQTGWFRWRPEGDPAYHWLARQIAAQPKVPVQFWLQVGSLEVSQMADGGPSQLAANRHFRDTLQSKGYSVSYHEYSGGHDAPSLEYPLARGIIEVLK